MSDTMQSLDQLSSLKPAAPEAPKYVKKVDKLGRAYATGKRKDAVARVRSDVRHHAVARSVVVAEAGGSRSAEICQEGRQARPRLCYRQAQGRGCPRPIGCPTPCSRSISCRR